MNLSYNQITDFTTAVELVKSNGLSFEYRDNPEEGFAQLFELCTMKPATVMAGQTIGVDDILEKALSELTGATSGGINDGINYTSQNGNVIEIDEDGSAEYIAETVGEDIVTMEYAGVKKEVAITVVKREDPVAEEDKISADQMPGSVVGNSALSGGQIWNWEDGKTQKVSEEEQLTKYVSYYVYRKIEGSSYPLDWTQEFLGVDVDGTLWGYKTDKSTATGFEKYKIAENVTDQILKYGFSFVLYIAKDGACYAANIDTDPVETIKICDNAVSITENGDVWTTDGRSVSPDLWANEENTINLELFEEPFEMVEMVRYFESTEDGSTVYMLALDTKGQLWKINAEERENGSGQWEYTGIDGVKQVTYDCYIKNNTMYSLDTNKLGKEEVIAENVDSYHQGNGGGMGRSVNMYLSTDKTAYTMQGEEILKNVKQIVGRYILDEQNDLYYLSSEREPISVRFLMPSVDKITRYEQNDDVMAYREDGSIWKFDADGGELPEKVSSVLSFQGEEPTEPEDPKTEIKDESTGIVVEGGKDVLEEDIILSVTKVENQEQVDVWKSSVEKLLGENQTVNHIAVFDITLMKGDQEIQPNGKVKVTIPIPSGFSNELAVFHQKDDGTLENMSPITVKDGKVSFYADSFSPYILVDLKKAATDPTTPSEPGGGNSGNAGNSGNNGQSGTADSGQKNTSNSPKTGDETPIALYLFLAASAFAGCVIVTRKKLNR